MAISALPSTGDVIKTAMPNTQLPEYFDPNFKIPTAQYQAPNAGIKGIMNSQLGQANDYANNTQSLINGQQNAYNRQAKQDLKSSIKNTREDFNKRGLLRSGLRQGAENKNIADTTSGMAANRYGLNQQYYGNQQTLNNNAVNSGLDYAGQGLNLGSSALAGQQLANQNDIAGMSAAGGLASSASYGSGQLIQSILSKLGKS